MSARAISEATGKRLLNQHLDCPAAAPCNFATVTDVSQWNDVLAQNPWMQSQVQATDKSQLFIQGTGLSSHLFFNATHNPFECMKPRIRLTPTQVV